MTTKEHIEKMFDELFKYSNIKNYWVAITINSDNMYIRPVFKGKYSSITRDNVKLLFSDLINWIVDAEIEDALDDPSTFNLLINSNISSNEIEWALNREKELIDARRNLFESRKTINKFNL